MARKNNRADKSVLEIFDKNGFVGYAKSEYFGENEYGSMLEVRPVDSLQDATKFCGVCSLQTVPLMVRVLQQLYPEFTRFSLKKLSKPTFNYTNKKPEQASDDYNYER
jgi:hypothetical protein